jgi:hypothetical protein
MPNYKQAEYFATNTSGEFDQVHHPGYITPTSGIYRCEACGYEAVSTKGHPLPPVVSCLQHNATWKCRPGRPVWRLVAAAVHVN